jgi:hypothetical protein
MSALALHSKLFVPRKTSFKARLNGLVRRTTLFIALLNDVLRLAQSFIRLLNGLVPQSNGLITQMNPFIRKKNLPVRRKNPLNRVSTTFIPLTNLSIRHAAPLDRRWNPLVGRKSGDAWRLPGNGGGMDSANPRSRPESFKPSGMGSGLVWSPCVTQPRDPGAPSARDVAREE